MPLGPITLNTFLDCSSNNTVFKPPGLLVISLVAATGITLLTSGVLGHFKYVAGLNASSRWCIVTGSLIEASILIGLIYSRKVPESKTGVKAFTEAEKAQYMQDLGNLVIPSNPEIDISGRSADFDKNYKLAALFKIIDINGRESLFDLREIAESGLSTKIYALFPIYKCDDQSLIPPGISVGWLVLQNGKEGIWICRIDNFCYDFGKKRRKDGKRPGVGSALVQFAVEKSIQAGLGGKVWLRSTNGSGPIFYKLGFACIDPQSQKDVETAISNNRAIDGGDMCLSKEAFVKWQKKIVQNPISHN